MNPTDRKALRQDILRELYDYNFENKGEPKPVVTEYNNDSERRVAYGYLNEKGLVHLDVKITGHERKAAYGSVKITARGVDVIENEYDLTKV